MREASCQEIIRRYYQALEKVVKDDSCQNEAYKIELIMKQAKISPKDRVVVPAAVNLAKETDAPAAAWNSRTERSFSVRQRSS